MHIMLAMTDTLLPVQPANAQACGRSFPDAFADIAARHHVPPDIPSVAVGTQIAARLVFSVAVRSVGGACIVRECLDRQSWRGRDRGGDAGAYAGRLRRDGPATVADRPDRAGALLPLVPGWGLWSVKPMTLMAIGVHQQPQGCWFPSVAY